MAGEFIADKIEDWAEVHVVPRFDATLGIGPKVRFRGEEIWLEGVVSPNCVATFLRWGVEIVRDRHDKVQRIVDLLLKVAAAGEK